MARAIDTYAFGDILSLACYGVHGALERAGRGYDAATCRGFEKLWHGYPFLRRLRAQHGILHPNGRVSPDENLLHRCNGQPELDELMNYSWTPAIQAAYECTSDAPSHEHARHKWSKVLQTLQTLRQRTPQGLFRTV
jgi:hypothetical protein